MRATVILSGRSQELPGTGHPISGMPRKENSAKDNIHTPIANTALVGGMNSVCDNACYRAILCHTDPRNERI